MCRARQVWLLALGLFLLPAAGAARSLPWDDYGPACQWVRLSGEIERPSWMKAGDPVWLTVTYSLPGQSVPATLLTKYPVTGRRFHFVLAGFEERIQGTLFVPPMFFFSERVEFQYFATLPGGGGRSPYHRSVYHPQRIKTDGQVRCQTAVSLETLRFESR